MNCKKKQDLNKGVTHAHLRPIWYHSEPFDVPFSPNQYLSGHELFSSISYSKPALRAYCRKVYTVNRGKHMTWHDLLEENRFIPRAWYLSLLVNWCVWCVVHDPLVLFIPRLLPSPTVETIILFQHCFEKPKLYCIFWCKTFR